MTSELVSSQGGDQQEGFLPPKDRKAALSPRHQALNYIKDQAREGRYIMPERLLEALRVIKASGEYPRTVTQNVSSDVRSTNLHIEEFGNDSVAHLGISNGTLNGLARAGMQTISSLVERYGVELSQDVIHIDLLTRGESQSQPISTDVARAYAEFQALPTAE